MFCSISATTHFLDTMIPTAITATSTRWQAVQETMDSDITGTIHIYFDIQALSHDNRVV